MSERYCCFIPCDKDAEFVVLSEGRGSDMTTDACSEHVGGLLESGVSRVWPITEEQ